MVLFLGGNFFPSEGSVLMKAKVINGDLLDQNVDVIVNAWNRNFIPWWLLLPQGVSGAIKKRAGLKPFLELPNFKTIPLGEAIKTSAGSLQHKAIIHVAGINLFWRASEYSIAKSVESAARLASECGYKSIAFPVIGAGSGGFSQTKALEIMLKSLEKLSYDLEVTIVEYS
jgi:O-acetyl-ADP-ribose deacetylase (regulator of RNase III)